jgi:tRNA pseudouridine synthase 9
VDEYEKRKAELMTGETCDVCDAPLYTDPSARELSLWLHSLRYQAAGGEWGYVTPLPKWALPPEGMDGPTEAPGVEPLVEVAKAAGSEIG